MDKWYLIFASFVVVLFYINAVVKSKIMLKLKVNILCILQSWPCIFQASPSKKFVQDRKTIFFGYL